MTQPCSDLKCPACQQSSSRVIDSRGQRGYIRRRRQCLLCQHRYSTREILVEQAILRVEVDARLSQLKMAITELRDELQSVIDDLQLTTPSGRPRKSLADVVSRFPS